jgi:uncharacterized membrane protein YedE/YeeE
MRKFSAFGIGLVFGLGLILSDMVNPARVRAFLDLFGDWDPTLVFVMAGAIAVSFLGWRIAAGRSTAFLGGALPGPAQGPVDRTLVGGAAVFGIGWGLAGICPGPGIVALMSGRAEFVIFFAAMLAGMALWNLALARAFLRPA